MPELHPNYAPFTNDPKNHAKADPAFAAPARTGHWYFTDANTGHYSHTVAEFFAWLARKFAFFTAAEYRQYEELAQAAEQNKQHLKNPMSLFLKVKIAIWKTGIGGLIFSLPGLILRLLAELTDIAGTTRYTSYRQGSLTILQTHDLKAFGYFTEAEDLPLRFSLLRLLDWLGKKLAFFTAEEYDARNNQIKFIKLSNLKKILCFFKLHYLFGLPGAILRFIAHIPRLTWNVCTTRKVDDTPIPPVNYLNEFRLMTLNIACLPTLLGESIRVNKSILRDNKVRAKEIIEQIKMLARNDKLPDAICLQEAFDADVCRMLLDELRDLFPYAIHQVGKGFDLTPGGNTLVGSGLLVLSRRPILDADYRPFNNNMPGEESLARKGLLGFKVQLDDQHFTTVYNMHLHAGGTLPGMKSFFSWTGGTTSQRRGEQMQTVANHMLAWEKTPPPDHQYLSYGTSFVTGDINTGIHNPRTMLSISTGLSNNGGRKDRVKYTGQAALFELLEPTVPSNFCLTRDVDKEGRKKVDLNDNLQDVKTSWSATGQKQADQKSMEGLFTGTVFQEEFLEQCRNNLATKNRNQQFGNGPHDIAVVRTDSQGQYRRAALKHKIVDAMHIRFFKPEQAVYPNAKFSSKIVSFGTASDHLAVMGTVNLGAPRGCNGYSIGQSLKQN